jgi:hypothetical protein
VLAGFKCLVTFVLTITNDMNTIIVKPTGNESVKANLKFRVISNRNRYDIFVYETYSAAKNRIEVLKQIFRYTTFEILVIE